MSGLPGSYIKKHNGDMKAAWADYRRVHGGKSTKKHHHSGGGGGGGAVTSTRPGGSDLKTTVRSRLVSEIDPSTLGAILYGMFMELESPQVMDTQDVLPAVLGQRIQTQATAIQSDEKAAWLNKYREEILIGREAVRTGAMGKVLLVLGIGAGRGTAHYSQAIQRANVQGGPVSSFGGGGFRPPFDAPTVVTSPFGAARQGGFHRGVDLRAAEGTPVHAPWAAKVQKVAQEDEGGNFVRLALQRPDGGYADDITSGDDSGILMSFLHLQSQMVKEGDVVKAGDVIGLSGNTGSDSDGPHLHIMAEFFQDKPWYGLDSNARCVVDPVALYGGEAALTTGAQPQPFSPNEVMGGLVFSRNGQPLEQGGALGVLGSIAPSVAGATSAVERPTAVTITNSGSLVIGGGTAVNVNAKAVLPLGEAFRGGTGDGGMSDPPLPDELRGSPMAPIANRVLSSGGSILRGVGSLAGQFFARVVSPQGLTTLVHLGSTLAQAAGSLAGIAGPLASMAAPALGVVAPMTGPAAPFVGALAAALEVAAPIASILGPILSSAGSFGNVLSGGVGNNPLANLFKPQSPAQNGGGGTSSNTGGGMMIGPLAGITPF